MNKRAFEFRRYFALLFAALLLFGAGGRAQDKAEPAQVKIPMKVIEGLKARFPQVEIDKWAKEKEGGEVVYDVEFSQVGLHYEADIKEDGTIINWEKAIAAKDLPAVVLKAVERMYPKANVKEVMQVTVVKNGKDVLEGYEIGLQTVDKKKVEVTLKPDGKVLEDSGIKE